jgi:hypothetical protein
MKSEVPDGSGRANESARFNSVLAIELYKIAYQEGLRALVDQQDELKGIRNLAVQFTSFVGAGTVVLVAAGVNAAHRNTLFYFLIATASGLSVLLMVLLFFMFQPSRRKLWHYRISASTLIAGWIENDVPPPSEALFLRAMANQYDEMRNENERTLSPIRALYRWLITVGSLQLALWAVLVLIKS